MAFTLDSSSDEGKLRVLLNDTDSTDYIFEDDYLTSILDLNSDDIWRAAGDLCRALAAKYAKEAFDLGLGKGDIHLDRRKKAEYYLQLSKTYDSRSDSDMVEYWDSFNINTSSLGTDDSEYIGDDT